MLVGAIVTCISLLFVDIQIHHIGIIVATVVLTSAVFSLGGLINAVYANSFDDISIIPTFVLTPLTYLGGVFYSISLLPDVWQMVSKANPIVYMVNAFRYGFLGVSDIDIGVAFGVLSALIVAMFTLALTLIKRGTGLRH